jgi:hypothetical protein
MRLGIIYRQHMTECHVIRHGKVWVAVSLRIRRVRPRQPRSGTDQPAAVRDLLRPAAPYALGANAMIISAAQRGPRAVLSDYGLVGFLLLLLLLLALALIAIIRVSPQDARSIELDSTARDAALSRPVQPSFSPGSLIDGTSAQPLPQRPVGQPGQRGYTARHAPGPMPGQEVPLRPKVTGGPPWGPAPRPPGIRP